MIKKSESTVLLVVVLFSLVLSFICLLISRQICLYKELSALQEKSYRDRSLEKYISISLLNLVIQNFDLIKEKVKKESSIHLICNFSEILPDQILSKINNAKSLKMVCNLVEMKNKFFENSLLISIKFLENEKVKNLIKYLLYKDKDQFGLVLLRNRF